jgi:hypothetical protein
VVIEKRWRCAVQPCETARAFASAPVNHVMEMTSEPRAGQPLSKLSASPPLPRIVTHGHVSSKPRHHRSPRAPQHPSPDPRPFRLGGTNELRRRNRRDPAWRLGIRVSPLLIRRAMAPTIACADLCGTAMLFPSARKPTKTTTSGSRRRKSQWNLFSTSCSHVPTIYPVQLHASQMHPIQWKFSYSLTRANVANCGSPKRETDGLSDSVWC